MTLKITTANSKRLQTWPYDDPRIFFWVSYDVSHEKLTWGNTILWAEGVRILAQTAPTKTKFLKLTRWFAWIWTTFGLVRRVRTVPNHSARTKNNHRQGRPRPAGNSSNDRTSHFQLSRRPYQQKWQWISEAFCWNFNFLAHDVTFSHLNSNFVWSKVTKNPRNRCVSNRR